MAGGPFGCSVADPAPYLRLAGLPDDCRAALHEVLDGLQAEIDFWLHRAKREGNPLEQSDREAQLILVRRMRLALGDLEGG